MSEETITITKKQYERLRYNSILLDYLEGCGAVDNWEGYSEARREMQEDEHDLD